MPVGVNVSTATRSAPSVDQQAAAATYFAVGITERGRSDQAQLVKSLADFERLYGGRVSYGALYADIQMYFEEGGGSAYIARTVGPAASVATKTLVDRAGSPINTLRIDALGAGAWGANVTIAVNAGSLSGYQIVISYSGTGANSPEIFDNLSTPADAVKALNRSAYVRATDLGSTTAAPNNQPALMAATPLVGGNDDRASVTATHYTAALALFGAELGAGAVSCPGQPASVMGTALTAHAVANRRLAITAPPVGQTLNQAIAASAALAGSLSSGSEYVGIFWPWVYVPDGAGSTSLISPEGYVAAARARGHEAEGPARAGAGSISTARFVVDVGQPVSKAQASTLNDANVNPIRAVHSGSIQIYGWTSLSTDEQNYALLTSRDVLNYIAVAIEAALEPFVFGTIDGKGYYFTEINAACVGVLEPLHVANQLFEKEDASGNLIDPGYRVDTNSVNTASTAQQQIANVAVSARPSPSAQQINAVVAKVALTSNV